MTINKTAYNTTACKDFLLHKTESALKAASAASTLSYVGNGMAVVQDGDSFRDAIPSFMHPFPFENPAFVAGASEAKSLAVDVRLYGNWSQQLGRFNVRNDREYSFAMLRLRLNHIWTQGDPMFLRNVSPVPAKTYASWISEGLGHKFQLDPLEQAKVLIVAAIFYASQFSDDKTMTKDEVVHRSGAIAKDIGIQQTQVMEIMDTYPIINDVSHFCTAVAEVASSVRLKELSPGLMFALMRSSWTGVNYPEMVAVAMEHPPTWVAMCYMALTDRSYRNIRIAQVAERQSRGDADKRFTNGLATLVENMAPIST